MDPMLLHNFLETPTNMGAFTGSFRIAGGDSTLLNQLKEINMQDKILINEQEEEIVKIKENQAEKDNNTDANANSTPKFRFKFEEFVSDTNDKNFKFLSKNNNKLNQEKNYGFENYIKESEFTNGASNNEAKSSKHKDTFSKRFSLDLDVVNQSDTKKIFSETVNNYKNENQIIGKGEKKQINSFADQNEDRSSSTFTDVASENNYINSKRANLQRDLSFINLNNNPNLFTNSDNWAAAQQEGKKLVFSTIQESPINKSNVNNLFDASGKFTKNFISESDLNKLMNIDETHDVNNINNNLSRNAPRNIKMEFLNKFNNLMPMISPSRAGLNVSPKSAFVFNKKLFN
jgi:hypothetical protein